MRRAPSPLTTLGAILLGHLPRLLQFRGWLVAALPLLVGAAGVAMGAARHLGGGPVGPGLALGLYHQGLVAVILPIMALVVAPAGIREDLEQRVLPFLLVRPVPVWVLPLSRGGIWFLWGTLWLLISGLGLGLELSLLPLHLLALVLVFWAELGFLSLLGLLFRRGTLWGALVLFLWDPLLRILPGRLQWLTFTHHLQSLTGTRSLQVRTQDLLAQAQLSGDPWAGALVLLLVGLVCWALAGWRLQTTPVGLAGSGGEG
nr:hypothetical protein [uncultured Holophaga sp.]